MTASVLLLAACGGDESLTTVDGSPISKSTTRVAEVNIVSAERDFSRTCLAPTAPDPGAADVARVVVTDTSLLDALCALGLGAKVTAVTTAPDSVPAYLGPELGAVATIGPDPDAHQVEASDPDVVLTTPDTAASAAPFDGTRVVTIEPAGWQERFSSVAAALGRSVAAQDRLEEFRTEARATGTRMDAAHSQVSLVRFTPDADVVAGTDSFAGQVLSLVGVDRPAPQRVAQGFDLTDDNFKAADADLIYVSFDGPAGQTRGEEVLLSDRWLDMGAPTWRRVLIVDDAVWYETSGLSAAWLVLNDLKNSLNGNS